MPSRAAGVSMRETIIQRGQRPVLGSIRAANMDVIVAVSVLAVINHPFSVGGPLDTFSLEPKKLQMDPVFR